MKLLHILLMFKQKYMQPNSYANQIQSKLPKFQTVSSQI